MAVRTQNVPGVNVGPVHHGAGRAQPLHRGQGRTAPHSQARQAVAPEHRHPHLGQPARQGPFQSLLGEHGHESELSRKPGEVQRRLALVPLIKGHRFHPVGEVQNVARHPGPRQQPEGMGMQSQGIAAGRRAPLLLHDLHGHFLPGQRQGREQPHRAGPGDQHLGVLLGDLKDVFPVQWQR